MAQDYTNMSVQDKLRLADERLEKLKGTDKYDAFKERVDAMHAKYGSVPETYTWADQKLNNKVEAYKFDAKAHGRVDKNGEADFQKDPLPMLDEWVVLGNGGDKYGISERGIMTRPIPKFFTRPTKPPSPDELADSYREATKPLDYLRLKRGGTVDELAASFKVMKRGLGTTQAAKGGEAPDLTGMSNFLATDKVPDTIFGIPVVSRREDYTEEDIAFFKEHPEAGGYYDMGDEAEGPPERPESPEPSGTKGAVGAGIPGLLASVLLPEGAKRAGFGDKVGALATRHGRTTQAGLEVDDPEPLTDDITMPEGAEGTLGVLLNFDEGPGAVIKKAYPNISEVPVLFARMDGDSTTGGYDPPSERFPHGRIVIAPGLSHSGVYGNLLHEMTHYVQHQEPGSHLGSTPEKAGGYLKYKGKIGELVAQTVEFRSSANPLGRALKDLPFHKALEKVREYNRLVNQEHVSGEDVYRALIRRPQEPERVIEIAK